MLPALPFPSRKDLVLGLAGAWTTHQPPTSPWHLEMPCCGLHRIRSCSCLEGVSITGMPWFAIAQFASRLQPSLLILARDSPGLFEEKPCWTVSLLRDGHHAMHRAVSLPGALSPGRGWDSAARPARSFPSARHHGSLQPPLLKHWLPFPSPGAGWRCEKSRLRHAVSREAWEKVLQTAMQHPEARFQLPTISFPAMLSSQAPTLLLYQQHQLGSGTAYACCTSEQQMQTTAPSLFSPHLNRKEGLQKAAAKFLLWRRTVRTRPFMPGEDWGMAAMCALN